MLLDGSRRCSIRSQFSASQTHMGVGYHLVEPCANQQASSIKQFTQSSCQIRESMSLDSNFSYSKQNKTKGVEGMV